MPFTISHAAAALPLQRMLGERVVLAALVIGTMAPDFPYYVNAPIPRISTHTVSSVLWFALPAGWLAYLAHRHWLRAAALHLAPRGVRARLSERPPDPLPMAVSLSLVLGALTHVVWDGFTHGSGSAVALFPWLRVELVHFGGYSLWSYGVLQHGSTLLGAAAISWAVLRWWRRTPPRVLEGASDGERRLRALGRRSLLVVPPLAGVATGCVQAPDVHDVQSLAWFVVVAVVAAMSATLAILSLVACFVRDRPQAEAVRREV